MDAPVLAMTDGEMSFAFSISSVLNSKGTMVNPKEKIVIMLLIG